MGTFIGAGGNIAVLDTNSTTNYPNVTKLNIGGSGVTITNPSPGTIALAITGGGSFVPYTGATADVDIGNFNLTANNLKIQNTTSSTKGVITKGGVRFMHNFQHPTGSTAIPVGRNTMLGESAGNFTMGSTATATFQGSNNTLIGYQSGLALTIGYSNVFNGVNAGLNTTIGYSNVFVGPGAGTNVVTGYFNVYLGDRAGQSAGSSSGYQNIGIGTLSLASNTTGFTNVFIGHSAGQSNTTGFQNAAIHGGGGNTTGYNNVFVGYNAGGTLADGTTPNQTANTSVFLGANTKALSAGNTNQIVIGNNAIGNGSNTVTIGNTSVTNNYFSGCLNVKGLVGGDMFYITNSANNVAFRINNSSNQSFFYGGGVLATTVITFQGDSTTGFSYNTSRIGILAGGVLALTVASTTLTLADAYNVILGTTTGSKIGTATTQKLSFWNATPIVQPTTAITAATFAAGGGAGLTINSTFDGYTIGQVVKALRNTGLLA